MWVRMSTHRRIALYWQNRNHPISLESEDKIKKTNIKDARRWKC